MDLINKVTATSVVRQALAQNGMKHVDYEREGMAFVSFAAERALVSTAGERRAIAYSLDEDKLIDDFLGERGTRVYGFYGSKIANDPQWRPYVNRIPRYQLDLSAAIAELEEDGFVYDAAGELYTAQSEGIRYRLSDYVRPETEEGMAEQSAPESIANKPELVAKLIPLSLTMGVSEDNEAANLIVSQLEQNLPKVGAQFNVMVFPMDVLLEHYYRQTARTCDFYFLGSNFMKDLPATRAATHPNPLTWAIRPTPWWTLCWPRKRARCAMPSILTRARRRRPGWLTSPGWLTCCPSSPCTPTPTRTSIPPHPA